MAAVTKTLAFTGAPQIFVTPNYVDAVTFTLWGAPGGTAGYAKAKSGPISGQSGAYAKAPAADKTAVITLDGKARSLVGWVQGTETSPAGNSYVIYVGGGGGFGNATTGLTSNNGGNGGYNGGGNGGDDHNGFFSNGSNGGPVSLAAGGGGGATDVRRNSNDVSARILVAGGGGGAAQGNVAGSVNIAAAANPRSPNPPYATYSDSLKINSPASYTPVSGYSYGGPGGSSQVGSAQAGGKATKHNGTLVGGAGGGGGQTGGGAGGNVDTSGLPSGPGDSNGNNGGNGSIVNGGNGASSAALQEDLPRPIGCGGGGGGGHYGGGGGSQGVQKDDGSPIYAAGGGGGGSNFIDSSLSDKTSLAGVFPVSNLHTPQINHGNSNGLCLVQYVQRPNPPTIVSPTDNQYVKSTAPLTLDWTFSSIVAGETQSAFDIDYQLVGAGGWTSEVADDLTSVTSYTFAGGTFTNGDSYNIRLRYYDSNGDISDYSQVVINVDNSKFPGAPTITSPAPNSTQTSSTFNLDFTVDGGAEINLLQLTFTDPDGSPDVKEVTVSPINLCTNPSFESNTTGWTSPATLSQSSTHAAFGTKSGKVVYNAGTVGSGGLLASAQVATIPGESYGFVMAVSPVTTGDPDVQIGVGNVGDTTPYAEGDVTGTFGSDAPGVFTTLLCSFVAQEPITLIMLSTALGGGGTAGVYLDGVIVVQGEEAASGDLTFFDGSTANGNPGTPTWLGTTNDSVSAMVNSNPTSISVTTEEGAQLVALAYSTVASLGQFSDPSSLAYFGNLDPPGTPTLDVTSDDDTGSNLLAITTSDTPNVTVSVDIYRADVTNAGPTLRIATGVPPNTNYTDYTPATNVEYAYRVRALSAAGGFADAGGDS